MGKTIKSKSVVLCLVSFFLLYGMLWLTLFSELGQQTDPSPIDPFVELPTIGHSRNDVDCNNGNGFTEHQQRETELSKIVWDVDYEIAFESWLSLKSKWIYDCPKSDV